MPPSSPAALATWPVRSAPLSFRNTHSQ
jgi:hypothetical protein